MIEYLLASLVFPIAQKIGEKWIDRIAEGLDEKSVGLLKSAVTDPSKQSELKEYLDSNPDSARKLTDNITESFTAEDTVASLAATVVPPRGAKLPYYAALINWIGRTGTKLGRHFVLKGFFQGELFLSYFIFNPDRPPKSEVTLNMRGKYLLIKPIVINIYVEKMKSEDERDQKFRTMNKKATVSRFGMLDAADYTKHMKITQIHEYHVLSGTKGEKHEIKTNEPIPVMIQSLRELLGDRAREVEDLRETIKNIKS